MTIGEVDPANGRERRVLNSLLFAELFEAFVNVREVVRRHVVYECPRDLVVANAAIEPA